MVLRSCLVLVSLLGLTLLAGCQDLVDPDDDGATARVAGEYWCRQFSVGTIGGACHLQPALVLALDGTYTFSSSTGEYTVGSGTVTFTGDLAERGPATLNEDDEIVWEFERDDRSYLIVYYLRERYGAEPPAPEPEDTDAERERAVGSYTCESMVDEEGQKGPCHTSVPLVLEADGGWHWSSDVGDWHIRGDEITFESVYGGGPTVWNGGRASLQDDRLSFGDESVWVRE